MWITTLFLLFSFVSQSEDTSTLEEFQVQVKVFNLRNEDGKVLLSLYDQEKGFPGESEFALELYSASIQEGTATFRITVPQGEYAVSVIHDENGNKELDATFLGLPKEGIGVSNNPKSFFGPPTYDKSKFLVKEDVQLEIKMLYM